MIEIINKKGFTLIELLVAMSIVSLIGFAFFKIVNSSILTNSKNERDIKSIHIAQTQIENIRSQLKKEGTLSKISIDCNDTNTIDIPYQNSNQDFILWIESDKKEILKVGEDSEYNNKKDDGTFEYSYKSSDDEEYYINMSGSMSIF
ncbi:MAG: type II secretion system protein [Paraclostridium sp.]